ncbi:MAG: hypothetical protein NTX30_03600, partial [Deltaproteobacteria bacterium]|nr:hypothetical protein [Deltaproteobacteria bacterium]
MNTDKHRFYWPKNQREKTEGDTDEHGYTRIIAEEKNRNGKTVLQLSKTPVPKADFCSQAIPELPPLPPFSKLSMSHIFLLDTGGTIIGPYILIEWGGKNLLSFQLLTLPSLDGRGLR